MWLFEPSAIADSAVEFHSWLLADAITKFR